MRRGLVALLIALVAACNASPLRGARSEPAGTAIPKRAMAKYRAVRCHSVKGAAVPALPVTFMLVATDREPELWQWRAGHRVLILERQVVRANRRVFQGIVDGLGGVHLWEVELTLADAAAVSASKVPAAPAVGHLTVARNWTDLDAASSMGLLAEPEGSVLECELEEIVLPAAPVTSASASPASSSAPTSSGLAPAASAPPAVFPTLDRTPAPAATGTEAPAPPAATGTEAPAPPEVPESR